MTDSPNAETLDLPVLPLRDVVVFPHMVIPLFVGRDKSIRALDLAMEADKRILLVAQKSAETDDPGRRRPVRDRHAGAGAATAEAARRHHQGAGRGRVARAACDDVAERDGALTGRGARSIEPVTTANEREIEAIARSLMCLFEQYVKTNRKLPPELLQTLSGIDDPSRLADTIAAHLGVRLGDKQKLLETHRDRRRAWNCWSASSTARSTCSSWRSASAAASSRRWRRASASTTSTSR